MAPRKAKAVPPKQPASAAPAAAPIRSTRAAKASLNPNQPKPIAAPRALRGTGKAAAPDEAKAKRVSSKKRSAGQEEEAAAGGEEEGEANNALEEDEQQEQEQERVEDSAQSSAEESEVEMDIQRLLTSPARGAGAGAEHDATEDEEEEQALRSPVKKQQKRNVVKFKDDKERKGPPGRRGSAPHPAAEPEQSEEEDHPRPQPMPRWTSSQIRAPSPSHHPAYVRKAPVASEETDEEEEEDLDRPDNEDRPKIFMHADARGENWRQDRLWLYPEFGGEGEREQLVKDIENNGGQLIETPNAGAYAIFPRGDIEAFRPEIEKAKAAGAHPIAQLWLEECMKATVKRARSGTPIQWRCRPQMYHIILPVHRKRRVDFTAQEKDTLAREMLKMKRTWEGVDERLACKRAMEKRPKTHELETWVRHLRHSRAEYEDRMRRIQKRREKGGRGLDDDSSDGEDDDAEERERRKERERGGRGRVADQGQVVFQSDQELVGSGEEEDLLTSKQLLTASSQGKGKKRAREDEGEGEGEVEEERERQQLRSKKSQRVIEPTSLKSTVTSSNTLPDPLSLLSTQFPTLTPHHLRGIYYYTSFSLPLSSSICSLILQGQTPAILWSPIEDLRIVKGGKDVELEGRGEEEVLGRWRFLRGCERFRRGEGGGELERFWHPSLEEGENA